MLHVYLDQNKWIDLSRGLGSTDANGARFRGVALAIERTVEAQQASFPLSIAHIFETWKRRKWEPRHALAATMSAISQNHAIAAPHALLPPELDRALNRRFGRPTTLLPLEPFGRGLSHAGGPAATQLLDANRKAALAGMSHLDAEAAGDELDSLLLAGPPEDLPAAEIQQPPLEFAENFATAQNAQAERFKQYRADNETRRRGVAALALLDIKVPTSEALARAGLLWSDFEHLGADGLTELLLELPSRSAALELMWRQYDNLETEWKPNDLNDIAYLSTAVGYCDVVVTERKWAHILNVTGAAARFNTTVLSNLDDLTEILDSSS
jgi:hypothetical protein